VAQNQQVDWFDFINYKKYTMKHFQIVLGVFLFSFGISQAQTIDELLTLKSEKIGAIADYQAQIDAAQAEINDLQGTIDQLSGWRKGLSGLVGFDFNNSNGWIASPNPDAKSSSLNIGLTGFLMNDKEKTFWHNKGIIQKAWNDVDLTDADNIRRDINGNQILDEEGNPLNDGLFNNGTVDILNISSLGGYKLSETFAISALAELNTSIGNFLSPGTLDFGIGATWLPSKNMTVAIHPFNYHIAWPSDRDNALGLSSQGTIGAKIRVDYAEKFNIAGKNASWSSTLTSFVPYTENKVTVPPLFDISGQVIAEERVAGLFEYTWINSFSIEVWKGIGLGFGFGIRKSNFESSSLQSYSSFGISYGF